MGPDHKTDTPRSADSVMKRVSLPAADEFKCGALEQLTQIKSVVWDKVLPNEWLGKKAADLIQNAYDRAGLFLRERAALLDQAAPHFRQVMKVLSSVYAKEAIKDDTAEREIPRGLTRYLYLGLLAALSPVIREAWGIDKVDEKLLERQLFRVFGWSSNKMKRLQAKDGRPDLTFISRDTAGGEPAPYQLHTHVDLQFAMKSYGLSFNELVVALAACHDVFEEGAVLHWRRGAWRLDRVNLNELIEKYPKGGLSYQLVVGIAALTESPFEEIKKHLPSEALEAYWQDSFTLVNEHYPDLELADEHFDKIHIADPLVFGGLAIQIQSVVRSLIELSTEPTLSAKITASQLGDLAEGIVAVEIADRMSDMASMDRYLDYYEAEPEVGRYKILAFTSRMLNMHEKLADCAKHLPKGPNKFSDALEGYLYVLLNRLDHVNHRLEAIGLESISLASVQDFHIKVFCPIQRKAEETLTRYTSERLHQILNPLEISSSIS